MAMNLQQERIDSLCAELGLKGLPSQYATLCQTAGKEEWSYIDFLDSVVTR